ncbi:hypothetical protein SAMN06265365_1313 [Tistlia consotensis]|uniref:Heat induced stress protein YflT n=1 Tax=Tistlia consotensis USBA 355 TaxID=560819 RepID=A0A1Y6CST3_9PROT|nr:hypothetical protein [Tistlia consotensis]SMF74153.1 hypothetical protein SAMN05428998_1333 [Tistlia consotensis USBA 355]SNS10248.1 hypothetical protein SAMN06265365_1313 [Tistlia consotensis]
MAESEEIVEVLGRFETREGFEAAVKALSAAGFGHADLSVLDTHETIDAAGGHSEAWRDRIAGLVGEVRYVGPVTDAGLIALAAGPVGALVASVIAAGMSGLALRELFDQSEAGPHVDAFDRALEHGAVLLWAYAPTAERQAEARAAMAAHGGKDIEVVRRRHKSGGTAGA